MSQYFPLRLDAPAASIVIPVRNSPAQLRLCLEHLRESRFRNFEVIVVDDASTDATADVAAEMEACLLRLEQQSGPAAARNRGAEVARGRYLVFLDADCCVHADTLDQLIGTLEADHDVAAVFGSYDARPAAANFVSRYRNLLHHFVHQTANSEAATFWAGCGAIRRDAFFEFGGFDAEYSRPSIEDIDLGVRLHHAGRRIVLNKHAQVTHLKCWTFWNMLKTDVCDRGIPWTRLILRHHTLPNDLNLKLSQRLSVCFAYALLASLLIGVAHSPLWLPFAVLFGEGIVLLNSRLYAFFARLCGPLFASRVIPLHVLYFLYSGLAFGVGSWWHMWDHRLQAQPVRRADEGRPQPLRWPTTKSA